MYYYINISVSNQNNPHCFNKLELGGIPNSIFWEFPFSDGRQCVPVLTVIIISWHDMWYMYICVFLYANLYICKMICLWRLEDNIEYCSFSSIKIYFLFTVSYSFLTNPWNAMNFPVSFFLCLLVLWL